jgi:hypothetical protein
VIRRERVPSLNPTATTSPPWRYRLRIEADSPESQTFNSFQHAASAGEQLAAERRSRLLYVEDDWLTLLADYQD